MLLLGVLLQGCGHKGPLFLPAQQPAPQVEAQPAPSQTTPSK
jgi:predicted small lipoprotein YifL